ncbi:MAG TPA: hypothetical protein VG165_09200 [Solirubrobacteraceae bacterium]|jgi:hypothetical protein|nr:hypothetical protein [Solirubrobacteraceae bacterium]
MAIQAPSSHSPAPSDGRLARRRAARLRRREIRDAVRGEWELEPRKRGWAALRAYASQVGELEQARLSAHAAHAELARRPLQVSRPGESLPSQAQAAATPAPPRAKRV